MKGLTLEQFSDIVKFVQKHHKFGAVEGKDLVTKKSYNIKYIDSIYDSRTNDVWSVKFRGLFIEIRFSTNHFHALNQKPEGWKYDNLNDLIMDYLKGDWVPDKVYQKNM